MNIPELTNQIYDEMVEWRRTLHRHPELSFEEHKTLEFIYNQLLAFGCDQVTRLCGTAVVALIHGGKGPGKCMAIRADIDGLPVTEETGYPFASDVTGTMHACGHDGHVAILLATAKILTEHRQEFPGTVKLIFQHGEEKFPGGAKGLVEAGVMEHPHVDAVIGLHIVPDRRCGVIRVKAGAAAIGCDVANVTITGKSGHAARPHEAHDALLAACQYVIALQQIVSRSINPKNTEIISVGLLNAGTAVNIIPGTATLSLNARSYDLESRDITKKKLYDIADGISRITDCDFHIDYVDGYEPTINHEDIVSLVVSACQKHLGEASVEIGEYDLGSDDFSHYMNATHTPGAYFFLLAGYEGDELFVNHHPRFTWKEDAMKTGVGAYLAVLMEYLNGND